MTSEKVQARRELMYEHIQAHPHDPLTLYEVATSLGRTPGSAFSMDLSAVRHMARERDDAIITNCTWDPDINAFAFYYLPRKQERDMATRPQRGQSRRMRTAVRNNGSQAGYLAKYGKTKQARAYGRLNVDVSSAIGKVFEAIEQYDHEMAAARLAGPR